MSDQGVLHDLAIYYAFHPEKWEGHRRWFRRQGIITSDRYQWKDMDGPMRGRIRNRRA